MFCDNAKSNFLIGNAFFKESMISAISLQPFLKGSHFLLFFPSQFIIIIIVIVLKVKPNYIWKQMQVTNIKLQFETLVGISRFALLIDNMFNLKPKSHIEFE